VAGYGSNPPDVIAQREQGPPAETDDHLHWASQQKCTKMTVDSLGTVFAPRILIPITVSIVLTTYNEILLLNLIMLNYESLKNSINEESF